MSPSHSDNESSDSEDDDLMVDEVNLKGNPVEIVVGKEKASYFAHEAVLREKSGFFHTALKKEWEEGQKRTIHLPDDEPQSVYAYVQWLYVRKLFVKTTDQQGDPVFHHLAKLYILGEKLLDDDFQDTVLSKLFAPTLLEDHPTWPGNGTINIIYEGTPQSSPARRLLVDSWVRHGHKSWVDRSRDGRWKVNDDFKSDLIQALLKNRSLSEARLSAYSDLEDGMICAYHKHGRDEPCTVTSKSK